MSLSFFPPTRKRGAPPRRHLCRGARAQVRERRAIALRRGSNQGILGRCAQLVAVGIRQEPQEATALR
eukprot:13711664-Alexandrium_andersonii.AAC.1